jgi:hypothetical protein
MGDHDAPESVIRIERKERSRSAGTSDQDASEPAFGRNDRESPDMAPNGHEEIPWLEEGPTECVGNRLRRLANTRKRDSSVLHVDNSNVLDAFILIRPRHQNSVADGPLWIDEIDH